MKRATIAMLAAAITSTATAQQAVYLCNINGTKAYMDKPCPDGKSEKLNLPPLPPPSNIKKSVELDGLEWSVLSVRRFYEMGDKQGAHEKPKKNHYVVVEMTIKNKSELPIYYKRNTLNLVCDGEQYNTEGAYLFKYQMGYERPSIHTIQPGAMIKTYEAFDVNSSNKCKFVIHHFTTGEQVAIDITP